MGTRIPGSVAPLCRRYTAIAQKADIPGTPRTHGSDVFPGVVIHEKPLGIEFKTADTSRTMLRTQLLESVHEQKNSTSCVPTVPKHRNLLISAFRRPIHHRGNA